MRSISRIALMSAVFWVIVGAPADAREDPMKQYGCRRHHFHHHKHAGYHCDTGPLAGQDFDSKADLVKALKAQGIDPSVKNAASKSKKPPAAVPQ
jgi:hypothetical protein